MKPLVINFDELFNNIVRQKDNSDKKLPQKREKIEPPIQELENNTTVIE